MESPLAQVQSLLEHPDPQPDKALVELTSMTNGEDTPWPVLHFIGFAWLLKKDHEAALKWLQKAIKAGDEEAIAYHAISICHHIQSNFEEAEEYEKQALEKKSFYGGWMHLATVYRAQAKLKEALDCYKQAVEIEPENTSITHQIAEIYRNNGRLDKALELFEFMTDTDDQKLDAYGAIAQILIKKQQFDEAEEYLNLILEEKPDHILTRMLLSDMFRQKGDYKKAVEICEELIDEDPASPVRLNYAVCLQELSEFDEAEENYLKALEDTPNRYQCLSSYLMCIHYNPQKTKQEIFEAHKQWDRHFAPDKRPNRPAPAVQDKDKKLRIGLLSGGFKRHPVGWMITGGLEHLPPGQFEIYCYTTDNSYDQITNRISGAADKWRSVIGYSDDVIAGMIRNDEIDILIELSGHASENRLRTVVREPAPVITKWVGGLFNTTGLQSIDYLITDQYETPAGEEEFYTEKLVRMPDDYISYLPPVYAPEVGPLPAEENEYITFGCFNNPSKINEEILAHWATIMNRLPESRLMLKSKQYDTAVLRKQIITKMKQEGITKERLIFKGQTNHKDHLSCYNQIDIALDPWPYSGGLTTCEALWMGVSVITKPGPTFAGRHSTTHLINAGFPDWVVDTWEEYVEKTVTLAEDMERLTELRSSMRQQMEASRLCNHRRFAAHLSVALRAMWAQRVEGYSSSRQGAVAGGNGPATRNLSVGWQDHITVEELSDEEIESHSVATRTITDKQNTEGPAGQAAPAQASNLDSNSTPTPARSSNSAPNSTPALARVCNSCPPDSESGLSENKKPDVFKIETKDGVTICTPPDLNMLTPYVLLEQEQWFEPELDFVRDYVKPGMNILDIGAGFGAYALPMAKWAGSEGQIYGFEPGSVARRHLEMSKLENNFENIQIIDRAVADQTGEAKWHTAGIPELNKLDEQSDNTVSRTTLDAWWQFAGNTPVDFIKIDVNGDEANVLAGAKKLLSKQSPVLLLAVGEGNMKNIRLIEKRLKKQGYELYEYIAGLTLLSTYDSREQADPYLMNLLAFKKDRAEELNKSGWLYKDGIPYYKPEKGYWKNTLGDMPWTESVFSEWKQKTSSFQREDYLTALDYLCRAEKIDLTEDRAERSKKGMMVLKSVKMLVQCYNDGHTGIPVALTLVRGLYTLGRRGQAVEVMKNVMEMNTLGEENTSVDLPFLLPLAVQDHTPIQTNFKQWLTVRIVEAWIQLKDVSTYFSVKHELELLDMLEGNTETLYWINKSAHLLNARHGESFDGQIFNSLQQKARKENISERALSNSALGKLQLSNSNGQFFDSLFWSGPFTPVKAKKIVELTDRFLSLEKDVLKQIVEETGERRKQAEDDNVAFFVQVHALLALKDNKPDISELNEALIEKGWGHKKALYSHWLERVEYKKMIEKPQVSAIIISNKFKEKSIENLKRLKQQLKDRGEIIFVSNGIKQEELEPLREHADVFVKLKGNSGAYLARNVGALFARGELLLFVDDDGIPDEGMVQAHIDAHDKSDILVSRGRSYTDDKSKEPWHYNLGKEIKPALTLLEGNAAYKAMEFFKVGGWGDYILFGHGGMELSYRLLDINADKRKQIYIPGARLHHNYHRERKHKQNKTKKQDNSFRLLNAKHVGLNQIIKKWPKYFDDNSKQFLAGEADNVTPSEVKIVAFSEKSSSTDFEIAIPRNEVHRIVNIFEKNEYSLPKNVNMGDELTVVDAGANVGAFALYAQLLGKKVDIYCFEPNPQVLPLLGKNTSKYSNITIFNTALGASDGELPLHQHPLNTGQTSTTFDFDGATSVKVPVRNAGEMLQEIGVGKIDVLKIDTEGAEVSILEGLKGLLPEVKIVMAEYHTEADRKSIENILHDFILYSAQIQELRGIGTVKYANLRFFEETG